ncbi:MAG: nucleoside phosphorylase [Desulfotignum sp.]
MNCPTWLDLSEASLVPPLGARQAPRLGPVGVMVSTLADLKWLQTTLVTEPVVPFFLSRLITDGQGVSLAGPFVGSPYAAMLMESLSAKGVRQIIVLGWCGGLTPDLQAGDLIVPDRGLIDEGTSRHYAALDPERPKSFPHEDFSRKLTAYMAGQGLAITRGPVWTTDAIYRETPKKIAWFKGQGAIAVEMECSALFSIAGYRNIQVAALLVVSDSLAAGNWDPGFKKQRFRTARQDAGRAVLSFARALAADGATTS